MKPATEQRKEPPISKMGRCVCCDRMRPDIETGQRDGQPVCHRCNMALRRGYGDNWKDAITGTPHDAYELLRDRKAQRQDIRAVLKLRITLELLAVDNFLSREQKKALFAIFHDPLSVLDED